eukprot:TRINITY_DN13839_c0_g6_i1.p1 TRINITY_DN13839_c0_g6~~TRINITY_DN13839_c0_g6_i1.p1  ORF type:complete len:322 (-),score=57.25 TRINITY_DN13839_c0_g6_i1:411-1376(-)
MIEHTAEKREVVKRDKSDGKRKRGRKKKLENLTRLERELLVHRDGAFVNNLEKVRKPRKRKVVPPISEIIKNREKIEKDELQDMADSEEVKEGSPIEGRKASTQKDSYSAERSNSKSLKLQEPDIEPNPRKPAESPNEGENRRKSHKFVVEKIVEKFPIIQELEPAQKPISDDFAQRLSKALIDKNRILSISLIQEKALAKPHVAPLVEEPAKNPAEEPINTKDTVRTLPTRPLVPVECKDHNHIHNSSCGHILVIHDDHIDALHDGELHFTNKSLRVYPHKLAISKNNPDVCDPICYVGEGDEKPLEELVTAHVRCCSKE